MRPSLRLSLLVLLASCLHTAYAETPPQYNRVSLNGSAQAEVENDLLVAVLFAQAEDSGATKPADAVNRAMDWAVSLTKSHPEVKVQTLGYRTQAIYSKNHIRGWRVSQSFCFSLMGFMASISKAL